MHPELDESDFLDENEHTHYQKIIGICHWLAVAGRIDICYAVSSLSRFSAAHRKGHLKLAQQVLGYLKKHQKKGYVVNIKSPTVDNRYQKIDIKKEFGNQYAYFKEDIDPKFPTPLINELDLSFFCDADHGHDKIYLRSHWICWINTCYMEF